jgi:hypothetical protein
VKYGERGIEQATGVPGTFSPVLPSDTPRPFIYQDVDNKSDSSFNLLANKRLHPVPEFRVHL